jgi:hypothetical protein
MLQWNQMVANTVAMGGAGFVLFIQGSVLAMAVLFIWLIARRRKNWARWVWLITTILGIPLALSELNRLLRSNLITATLTCAGNLAQIVALYLIFTGNAREWFRPSQPIPPNPA